MRADIEAASQVELKYPNFHRALFLEDFKTQWEGHVLSLTSFLHLPLKRYENPVQDEKDWNLQQQWKTLFTICIMEVSKEF